VATSKRQKVSNTRQYYHNSIQSLLGGGVLLGRVTAWCALAVMRPAALRAIDRGGGNLNALSLGDGVLLAGHSQISDSPLCLPWMNIVLMLDFHKTRYLLGCYVWHRDEILLHESLDGRALNLWQAVDTVAMVTMSRVPLGDCHATSMPSGGDNREHAWTVWH